MYSVKQFINTQPVFTWSEFEQALGNNRTLKTLRTEIKYYLKTGKIARVKPGLYYVRNFGNEWKIPDKYLVAAKVAEDGYLSFHSAFELLGYSHSVSSNIYVMTTSRVRKFQFQSIEYIPVAVPKALDTENKRKFGTEKVDRAGEKIRITGKERTIIDSLDRPEYAGGYEELFRCIGKVPYIDFDILYEYLGLRRKKVLFAKTGFILERYQEDWFVKEEWLEKLENYVPKSPAYFVTKQSGKLLNRWNLIVPKDILENVWEEM